jgi:hypothetical protein
MGSATLTIPDEVKNEFKQFPWINWSELAREELVRRFKLEEAREQLGTEREQDFINWSVQLGRKARKGRFEKLLRSLPEKERGLLKR